MQPRLTRCIGARSLQQGKSSSTGNLLDKEDLALPPPDYGSASRAFPAQTAGTFKQRPYSVAVPAFSQVSAGHGGGGHGWVWAPAQGVTGGHSPASSGLRAPEKAPWPSVRPPSAGVALASGRRLSGGALSQKAVGFHSHGTECTCPSAFGARWSEQKVEAWVLGVGSPWPPGVHGSLEVRAGLGRGCGWRCTALRGKLVGLEGQASGTLVCCGRVLGRAWGWGQGPKQGREGENAWKRAQVS